MDKEEGVYVLLADFPALTSPNKACIPLQYCNGEAYVLSIDNSDCSLWQDNPIKDFATISEEDLFERISIINPSFSVFPLNSRTNYRLKRIKTDLGQNYYSIYRPIFSEQIIDDICNFQQSDMPSTESYLDLPISNRQEYSNLLRQLEIILDDIDNIFKVVAPHKKQMSVYGHALRNAILLACTELDSRMQTILKTNAILPIGKYFQMIDYYQLRDALKLDQYVLSFHRFNDLGTFSPFAQWKENTELSWYKAYNNIKHDREEHFSEAKLFNAINAVMAFAIILIAQYGYRNDLWKETIGKIIKVDKEPQWSLEDLYFSCPEKNNHILYPFPKYNFQNEPMKQLAKRILNMVENPKSNKDEIIDQLDKLKKMLKSHY